MNILLNYARPAAALATLLLGAGVGLRAESPQAAALRRKITDEVIARWSPDICFHKNERYFPTSAEDLFKGAKVFEVAEGEKATGPARSLAGCDDLKDLGPATRVAFDPSNPKVLDGDTTGSGASRVVTAPMYVSVQVPSDGSLVALRYFFLFGFNGSQSMRSNGLADALGGAGGGMGSMMSMVGGGGMPASFNYTMRTVAEHEGDWEGVELRLKPDLATVISVRTEAHGNSMVHGGGDVAWTEGSHPRINLALNSHGVYNGKGKAQEDVFVLENLGPASVVDIITQSGPSWRPWTLPASSRPFRRFGRLDGKPVGELWTLYRGRMGTHKTNAADQVVDLDGKPLSGAKASIAGAHLGLFQGGSASGKVDQGIFNGMPCGGPGSRPESNLELP